MYKTFGAVFHRNPDCRRSGRSITMTVQRDGVAIHGRDNSKLRRCYASVLCTLDRYCFSVSCVMTYTISTEMLTMNKLWLTAKTKHNGIKCGGADVRNFGIINFKSIIQGESL